jgi:hypothetical protein
MLPASPSPRRPFWRRLLKTVFYGLALVLIGLVLTLAWTLLSGLFVWEKLQTDLRARGEKLKAEEFTPPLPPPERNFFAAPMWQELTDLVPTTDINGVHLYKTRLQENKLRLAAMHGPVPASAVAMANSFLKPHGSPFEVGEPLDHLNWTRVTRPFHKESDDTKRKVMARLIVELFSGNAPFRAELESDLRKRPEAVFPTDYTRYAPGTPSSRYVENLGKIYAELAQAHIALDDRAAAKNDILVLFRLSSILRNDPGKLSLYDRSCVANYAMNAIATGIERHLWTADDLRAFEQELSRIDLVADLPFALRSDRAKFNHLFSTAAAAPNAKAAWDLIYDDPHGSRYATPRNRIMEVIAAGHHLLAPGDQSFYNRHIQSLLDALAGHGALHPQNAPFHDKTPGLHSFLTHCLSFLRAQPLKIIVARIYYTQDQVRQSRVACALEAWRLAHDSYPASLQALPAPYGQLHSPIANAPFHYLPKSDDSFRLWSDGWNKIDDGASSGADFHGGDWVWGDPPRRRHER